MKTMWLTFIQIRNQLLGKINFSHVANVLPWIVICFGVVLRLAQYLFNRSLWIDEALLALNIINRSFLELLQPLDYNQGAPVGFLMLEKLAVQTFGSSEYALRLFPFLFGIISLYIFYVVAKQCIRPNAVFIALSLFAISDPLIYYSSEAKQYSSDVTITLLIILGCITIQSKKMTTLSIILFGLIGATVVWFSHPSVFILAGVGASLTLFSLKRKEWSKIKGYSLAYSLWGLSFVVIYFFFLSNLSHNQNLLNYWSGYFMPFPPLSVSDFRWFVNTFFEIFKYPVGLTLSGIAALTFLIGCFSIFLERKEQFFILISPILFTLLVSGFHKYPFGKRLILYIVPLLLLFIAEGAEQFREKIRYNSSIIGMILIGLLFFHPLLFVISNFITPRTREEIRPVIEYVKKHHQDEDVLYLYYDAKHAFNYYSQRYDFYKNNHIVGKEARDKWVNYIDDLDTLRGNERVWILFSHVVPCTWRGIGINEEKFFLYYLDRIGKRLDFFKSQGAAVYLYDLKEKIPKTRQY